MTVRAANQRVFGILCARNEQDLLRANILHHLWIGCERVLVVDNASTDGSRRILKKLARTHSVDWTSDEGDYRQSEIVTGMAHDARARGADWVIPLDVDEFWHPWEPLQGIVGEAAAKGLGALEVRRIEFIQARDQVETTMAGSRRATWRVERPLAGDAAMAEFMAGERSMFETEPQPKWIVRTTPDLRIAMGGHSAENTAGPTEVCLRISIFHLAMRSRKRAQDRVEHAVRVDLVDKRTNVSVQNRYWKMMAERGDLDGAWRAHSSEDGALDVFGRRVELIEDNTMADLLEPYTRSRLRQWVREKRRPRIGPV